MKCSVWGRIVGLAFVTVALGAVGSGCASSETGTPRRDAGTADVGPVDANADARSSDSGRDSSYDANADAGRDVGPHDTVQTCEACTTNDDCDAESFCAHLVTGEHACLPGCNMEFPSCPRGFTCIFDATGTGVNANVCAPVGGPCCVDEDSDDYGVGVGCMGPDCNDNSDTVHPDRDEVCDGLDTNCNSRVDENPNDCGSGRCTPDGDGSYSAIVGGMCVSATCQSGTTSDCALYTCSEGGDRGTTCATTCAPAGTDDDTYCIATAHCDGGVCVSDVPDGGTCDEDSDCNTTHCDNGYCCGSGTCCATDGDCPGGGMPTRVCDNPRACQGHRGVVTCESSTCRAVSGIDDDTACTAAVEAISCGLVNPVQCAGGDPQPTGDRTCPAMCLTDGDCIAAAHCQVGFCVPDLPPGGTCGRNQDCMPGLTCVDNTCCTSVCNGSCEACNLPGSQGTCTPVPPGADPAGECAGFACTGYYAGFQGNVCSPYAAVSDSVATCDGAGACRTPALLCPMQTIGSPPQITCNPTCQTPVGGTCSGTTPGACTNLDNPMVQTTCGTGACQRTVQTCVGGAVNMCMAGTPVAETCDGIDNDCNGTADNGGDMLCPAQPNVTTQSCRGTMGCAITGCAGGWADYDATRAGCECSVANSGPTCAGARALGSFAPGTSMTVNANINSGNVAWFSLSFPPMSGAGGRGGTPTISIAPAALYSIRITQNCAGTAFTCNASGDVPSSAAAQRQFEFSDTIPNGPTGYTSSLETWPDPVYVQVTRTSTPTTCEAAAFDLTISR